MQLAAKRKQLPQTQPAFRNAFKFRVDLDYWYATLAALL